VLARASARRSAHHAADSVSRANGEASTVIAPHDGVPHARANRGGRHDRTAFVMSRSTRMSDFLQDHESAPVYAECSRVPINEATLLRSTQAGRNLAHSNRTIQRADPAGSEKLMKGYVTLCAAAIVIAGGLVVACKADPNPTPTPAPIPAPNPRPNPSQPTPAPLPAPKPNRQPGPGGPPQAQIVI
jgi:hypothetical protein